MAEVIAKQRGYFGGQIREVGDRFEIPDDLWGDKKRRPSWAAPAAFGGKGDHDGDGKVGGSVPAPPAGGVVIPEEWRKMSAGERRALAQQLTGEAYSNAKDADAAIELHLEANAKPEGNGVVEALGGPAPDWLPPGADGKPVMAND